MSISNPYSVHIQTKYHLEKIVITYNLHVFRHRMSISKPWDFSMAPSPTMPSPKKIWHPTGAHLGDQGLAKAGV